MFPMVIVQVGQVGIPIPGSVGPTLTHRTAVSPQRPFMTPQFLQGTPVSYQQSHQHGPQYPPPEYQRGTLGGPAEYQRGTHGGGSVAPMMAQGHPFMPPQGQDYYQAPPMMNIPPAAEMLKGWCLTKKLAPPKFNFQQLQQARINLLQLIAFYM